MRCWEDSERTIPAQIGSRVAVIDRDDGEPNAIVWHHAYRPVLSEDNEGKRCVDFSELAQDKRVSFDRHRALELENLSRSHKV